MKRLSGAGGVACFGSPGIEVTEAGGGSSGPFRPQAETALTIATAIRIVVRKEWLVIDIDPVIREEGILCLT
jgi:hypothetical protein